MNELVTYLQAHEPIISAVVGIITISAGIWGFIVLALRPMFANADGTASKADKSSRPSVWSSLIGRGVSRKDDYAKQMAGRTLNACLMIVTATALFLVLLGLVENGVAISAVNLFLFLAGIVCYNLHAAGFSQLPRWILVICTMLYWNLNIVLMGPRIGLEYCMGAVLLLPLLLFEREQWRTLVFLCSLITLSLPASLYLEGLVSDIWPFNAVEIPVLYYHGNAVFVAGMVFWALYFYNQSADNSFHLLEDQQAKTAELIHSLLPAYIAEKVKMRGPTVADWHSEATVLFATVTGFDGLYQRVSAVQLVEILRDVFEQFDELVSRSDVEKINTLGTNYVAATGIDPNRTASTKNLALVALGMLEVVKRLSKVADHPFGIRVGISTGDVVSGVIGDDRPSFDIWGKTVELAHAIRTGSEENTIVVSDSTFWRLKTEFEFEEAAGSSNQHILIGLIEP